MRATKDAHRFFGPGQLPELPDALYDEVRTRKGVVFSRNDLLPNLLNEVLEGVVANGRRYRLSKTQYFRELAHAWSMTEFPGKIKGVRGYFAFAGEVVIDDERTVVPGSLTIYRGAPQRLKRGYSWTTDVDKARWFARRFSSAGSVHFEPGFIWEAEITSSELYAIFLHTRELEIVVNPRRLRKLRVVEGPFPEYALKVS